MSLPAFYLPPDAWASSVILTGPEASHARVLRLGAGEKIVLLDGKGREAIAVITKADKKGFDAAILEEHSWPMPRSRAIVALALSKAVRRSFFLEKAAELGAWAIWLWQAERSQGELTEKLLNSSANQIMAGAKQCHNPWFPSVSILADARSLAEASRGAQWRLLPWEEKADMPPVSLQQLGREGETVYVIGPEGGLTNTEVSQFETLGKRVLRCETAATLCLGLHWWASQLPGMPNQKTPV